MTELGLIERKALFVLRKHKRDGTYRRGHSRSQQHSTSFVLGVQVWTLCTSHHAAGVHPEAPRCQIEVGYRKKLNNAGLHRDCIVGVKCRPAGHLLMRATKLPDWGRRDWVLRTSEGKFSQYFAVLTIIEMLQVL